MLEALERTRAAAVVVAPAHRERAATAVLVADNPYAAYARAAQLLHPEKVAPAGVDPMASVAGSARIEGDVHIGAWVGIEADVVVEAGVVIESGAIIGRGARIGRGTRVGPNVVVRHDCIVGAECWLQAGAVIGGDGFGFARDGDEWIRIPQLGRVVIGDGVHIGANTSIDRGSLDDTVIGEGVILDNQIQIAHNVRIGEATAMAGCVGVAGSAVIGRRCAIGGGAGILGHLEIVDDVQVTAMSLVHKSITLPGTYSSGVPLQGNAQWRRNAARFRRLDCMARRLSRVETMVGGADAGGRSKDDES